MAFILVAVVCGFVIAAGLRASALTVVVSGREPASFGASSGAVLGPVLRLREDGTTTIENVPLLSGDEGRSTTSRPAAHTTAASHHTATVALQHTSTTGKPKIGAGTTVAKPVVPATPRPGNGGTSKPTVAKPTTGAGSGGDQTSGSDDRGRHGHGRGHGKGHGADKARAQVRDEVTPSTRPDENSSGDFRGNGKGKGHGKDQGQDKADKAKGHGKGHGKGNRHRHR